MKTLLFFQCCSWSQLPLWSWTTPRSRTLNGVSVKFGFVIWKSSAIKLSVRETNVLSVLLSRAHISHSSQSIIFRFSLNRFDSILALLFPSSGSWGCAFTFLMSSHHHPGQVSRGHSSGAALKGSGGARSIKHKFLMECQKIVYWTLNYKIRHSRDARPPIRTASAPIKLPCSK
jgi:hypothetical protein